MHFLSVIDVCYPQVFERLKNEVLPITSEGEARQKKIGAILAEYSIDVDWLRKAALHTLQHCPESGGGWHVAWEDGFLPPGEVSLGYQEEIITLVWKPDIESWAKFQNEAEAAFRSALKTFRARVDAIAKGRGYKKRPSKTSSLSRDALWTAQRRIERMSFSELGRKRSDAKDKLDARTKIRDAVRRFDGIVGFVMGGRERSGNLHYSGELYAIYVLDQYHRQGIGAALVRQWAGSLRQAAMNSALVWVLAENKPAIAFYERLGGRRLAEQMIDIGGTSLKELAFGWKDLSALVL